LNQAPYYIIFKLKKQLVLKWLPVRVVVNNQLILALPKDEPVILPLTEEHPALVLTDGFHVSSTQQLHFNGPGYFSFEVVTPLTDWRLFKGGVVMCWLFVSALLTGYLFFQIASVVPIVVALLLYYFNRKNFLRLRQINHPPRSPKRAGV
jgi:hypothetical protein